jgi:hypothetical protein
MSAHEVGKKLVSYCQQGDNLKAIEELYADDVTSIEAMDDGTTPREMKGKDAVRGKNEWWIGNHEIHSASVQGPYPHDERFAVLFSFDVTAKDGPMKGQRMQMEEVALYTVDNGKIAREEFFYTMG